MLGTWNYGSRFADPLVLRHQTRAPQARTPRSPCHESELGTIGEELGHFGVVQRWIWWVRLKGTPSATDHLSAMTRGRPFTAAAVNLKSTSPQVRKLDERVDTGVVGVC